MSSMISLKSEGLQAGEMGQWVACWLLKHEDLSSTPQCPCKMPSDTCDPSWGFEERSQGLVSQPAWPKWGLLIFSKSPSKLR